MSHGRCLNCLCPPPKCQCAKKRYLRSALLQLATGIIQYPIGKSANSVAVVGDAWHTLVHVASYCLGIAAESTVKQLDISGKREKRVRSFFGLGSAAAFLAVAALIIAGAVGKIYNPVPMINRLMILGAAVGFIGNAIGLKILHPEERLWHIFKDVFHEEIDETHHWFHRDLFFDGMTSLVVLIGALGNVFFQTVIIDIVFSFLVATAIVANTIYMLYTGTFKNL